MNKPLRRVALACLLLFGLLMLNANYVQFVRADDVTNDAGNRRLLLGEYSRERGPILVGGQPVAESVATPDELKYLRQYPGGPLYAHVTGFYSFVYGAEGIERTSREVLAGTDDRLFVGRMADLLTGDQERGGSVVLTLDPAAQQAALDALEGQVGAVTAIDPQTGAILAMVSNPSYDPSPLASHDATVVSDAWEALNADPARPMLNRSLRESYPPGSTFKIITAAAALSTGAYDPETELYAPRALPFDEIDYTLPNQGGAACAADETATLREALRISCNTAFANLGNELGARAVREQAERFGFNATVDVPMTSAESAFPGVPAEAGEDFDPDSLNDPQLAQSSIGQLNVRATPLQMAMVVAGIANDGVVMRPYLVQETRAPDLAPLETTEPEELSEAVTPEVAAQLRGMLVTVVEDGTGSNAQISGVTVGGKTGTAQTAPGRAPYAWFVSFAPEEDPQVAVAVLIEQAAVAADDVSGGRIAAPIARAVMEAVLE